MKKLTWMPIGLLTMILVAGFVILQSSTRKSTPASPTAKPACSKKAVAECTEIPARPGDLLMENVSRQFLMIR